MERQKAVIEWDIVFAITQDDRVVTVSWCDGPDRPSCSHTYGSVEEASETYDYLRTGTVIDSFAGALMPERFSWYYCIKE